MLPAKRKIPVRFLPLALLAFLPTLCVRAQESSSRPIANASSAAASAPGSPTAALRDAISAACSQSEQAFAKSLTARNADTFAHLTPSARVAFMKRFVLLNEPGKPSLLPSPSGRPIVHCQTPGGAAELQIGGAETADNPASGNFSPSAFSFSICPRSLSNGTPRKWIPRSAPPSTP